MAQLLTNRTTANTAAEHVADHNEAHGRINANITVGPTGEMYSTIQAAVNAANTAGGGHIKVRQGTYNLTSSVTLYSNIEIHLERGAVVNQTVAGVAAFAATGTATVPLSNITLRGGKVTAPITGAAGGTCIAFNNVKDSIVDRVETIGGTLTTISFTDTNRSHVKWCAVSEGQLCGIRLKGSSYNNLVGNHIFDIGLPLDGSVAQAVYLWDGLNDYNLIAHNHIENIDQSGIRIEGNHNRTEANDIHHFGFEGIYESILGVNAPANGYIGNIHVENKVYDGNLSVDTALGGGHPAIWIQHNGSTVIGNKCGNNNNADAIVIAGPRAVVVGNSVRDNVGAAGIKVTSSYNTVLGNKVDDVGTHGLWLSATNATVQGNTLIGNSVTNAGRLTTNTYSGIRLSASTGGTLQRNTVTGNSSIDNQTTPTHKYGLELSNAGVLVDNNIVSGNTIVGWVTGETAGVTTQANYWTNTTSANVIAGSSSTTNPVLELISKFGYKWTLNASGGNGLNLQTTTFQSLSGSSGLARFAHLNATDTAPVIVVDNRSAGKSIYINNNGAEKFSVAADGATSTASVKTTAYATASRPSATTLGVGTRIYDSTLNKPIWSDGSAWRDAAGAAV